MRLIRTFLVTDISLSLGIVQLIVLIWSFRQDVLQNIQLSIWKQQQLKSIYLHPQEKTTSQWLMAGRDGPDGRGVDLSLNMQTY